MSGGGVLALLQETVHFPRRAPGGRDDALGVCLQKFAVHAGLVVVALQAREAAEPEQVVHAGGVFGEQRHVGVHLAGVVVAAAGQCAALALGPMARREVALHADDRIDARSLRLLVEVVGPEDVAMIGHRERRHPHARGLGEQVVQPRGTVEHRVLGVHMEVDERIPGVSCHTLRDLPSSAPAIGACRAWCSGHGRRGSGGRPPCRCHCFWCCLSHCCSSPTGPDRMTLNQASDSPPARHGGQQTRPRNQAARKLSRTVRRGLSTLLSTRTTLCQVPRAGAPSTTGNTIEGETNAGNT